MAKKLNLKNDVVFKAFFGRKGKEQYLTEFLEALLGIKIDSIEIKEEVNVEKLFENEKGGRLDMQATLNYGKTIVNVEMQRTDRKNIQIRTIFYGAKIISREAVVGTNYEDMQKTILVNILDYDGFPEYEDYILKTAIVLDKHREFVVTDKMEWWYIVLPNFRKQRPDMNETINQWLAFIDDENKELVEMAEEKNETLKKAMEDMEYLTGNEEVKRMAELREKWEMEYEASMNYARKAGAEEGEKIGREQGEKIGREQGEKIGREQGEKIGREQGEKIGREQGEKIGREQGEKIGREQGEKIGREQGEKIGQGERIGREQGERIGREQGERIGREQGERIGREEGERIGRKATSKENAKKMLELNIPIEQIIEVTGLTREEIESLK